MTTLKNQPKIGVEAARNELKSDFVADDVFDDLKSDFFTDASSANQHHHSCHT
jgi:hypothetical protein